MDKPQFSKGNIEVTRTVARFGNTTYPIANIGAVSIEKQSHSLIRLAIFCTIGGLVWMLAKNSVSPGIFAAIGGAVLWVFCAINYGAKLMLRTSSGNEQAFESSDRALVAELKSAIETAIHSRG